METYLGSMSNGGGVVMLCAMFVIVFVCIQKAVKEMSFFGDAAGWVVAFCVALLSIIGLVRFFGSPASVVSPGREPRETGGLLDFVLLPYVVLGLTILLVLLLLAVGKVLHGRELWHRREAADNHRTIAKLGMREGDRRRRETKPFEPSDRKQIITQKNGKAIKKLERER